MRYCNHFMEELQQERLGGFYHHHNKFYQCTNLQGDVMYLVDSSGAEVAAYDYDPYGKIISATGSMAEVNPLRYRGYYYDSETGFYYLQSRYYDPEICRFISADDVSLLTLTPGEVKDLNLFSYCDNNPVVRADVGGDVWHYFIGAAVGAAIGATVTGIASYIEDGKVDWTAVGLSAIFGAASGALAASSIGVVGIAMRNAAISMTENAAAQVIHNGGFNNFSVGDMLSNGAFPLHALQEDLPEYAPLLPR